MRLHLLRLRAIGPYAAEQEIDFGRLASSGLFLLEGPTGAGKTTILDAVTFALYGGLAGEGAGRDRLHSDFAAPGVEPSVTCEFSLRGDRYRIERVPEYQRPKKRGGGFTTEPMRVHLQRLQGGAWVSLSSNKAEAAAMITEAVGLNREQFTQVMLLPQGEFARFLRCGDDERREVLTKLFGTQLYDRITAELERRRSEASRAREESRARIDAAVSAAAEAAGLDADARASLLSLPRAEREASLKELAEDLASTAAVTGEALEVAVGDLAKAQAAGEQAKRQAALMSRLTTALAGLREHETARPEHEERKRLLDAARRAGPVRPLLDALTEAEAATSTAREALIALTPGAGEDVLAGRGGPQARAKAEAADQEAARLQYLAGREPELREMQARLESLQQSATAAADRVAALERATQELPGRLAALATRLAEARETAAGLEAARQRQAAIATRSEAAGRLARLQPLLAASEAAARTAIDTHQRCVDDYQRAMDARLAGIAAELARDLADGAACPVCGSLDHPAPAPAADAAVPAAEAGAARRRRDDAEAVRRAAEAEREKLRAEVAADAAVADGGTVDGLAAEAVAVADLLARAEQAAQAAVALEGEQSQLRAEQDRVSGELRQASADAAAVRTDAKQARLTLDTLRAELADEAQGYGSVSARQAALRRAAAADRALGEALDALATHLDGEAGARRRASGEASQRGFATLEEARAAVLAPGQESALARQAGSWEEKLAALTAAAQADDLRDLDEEAAGEVQAAAAQATGDLAAAQEAEREVRDAHEQARRKAERLNLRREEVRGADQRYDDLVESTEAVIRLAGLAKGTDGQRRIALTTYVLRHWFGQVVAAANVRLSAMSSGRFELKRTDEGENRRQRTGLTLAVIDRHTGEQRSPASLSGGETFYTSLALALGLADVVKAEAGGVDLDTLFIDEGFGSLDAQTLEEVMAVIDDLRDRGRVVGIVSHVADLKERVPERLEIRRLADGSSTVRVVA